jgi:cellulose biosynthesis protein BcsQ
MTVYSFWNNKGGVGKSYLCFVAAAEYAHRHPEADVYVIDLCPQANVSETLLGGFTNSPTAIHSLYSKKTRATVAGYIEARLSSPFKMIDNVEDYISRPSEYNKLIPDNLYLICGDNLLEVLAEAIRQTSQLAVPIDAWKQVVSWVKDLNLALKKRSGDRDSITMIDCNPSFAIFTQLALVASDNVIVPFTADDSSRRGIENVVALLYGISDPHTATYAKISFSKRAKDDGIEVPKLHTFVCNRVTFYEGKPSKAFEAVSKTIKTTMNRIHSTHRGIFAKPTEEPSQSFIEIPDYHSASIVSSVTGTPIHRMKSGPRTILGERIQINPDPLTKYSTALKKFVDAL